MATNQQNHILHRNIRRFHLNDYPYDAKNGLLNSLVSYWKLDEAAGTTRNDSTASANNLTQPVGTCGQSTGLINFAANTNGGTSKLRNSGGTLSTFWAQIQPGDSFSVSTWIKFNSVPSSGFHGVVSFWGQGTNLSYFLWFNNSSTLELNCRNAANTLNVAQTVLAPPSTATWYHVVFGFDNANNQQFYYLNNGTRQNANITGIYKQTSGTATFELMDYAGSNGPPDMIMDETGWWRKVLTAQDVNLLYNNARGTPYSSFTT